MSFSVLVAVELVSTLILDQGGDKLRRYRGWRGGGSPRRWVLVNKPLDAGGAAVVSGLNIMEGVDLGRDTIIDAFDGFHNILPVRIARIADSLGRSGRFLAYIREDVECVGTPADPAFPRAHDRFVMEGVEGVDGCVYGENRHLP